MEKAINKALEGGYKPNRQVGFDDEIDFLKVNENMYIYKDRDSGIAWAVETILYDVNFWMALGRVEGWYNIKMHDFPMATVKTEGTRFPHIVSKERLVPGWVYHWHSFIDHLAEGKPIDDFFNNLLT